MKRPVPKPGPMRLTLAEEVLQRVRCTMGPINIRAGVKRTDGKWDVLVSYSTFDQLQTIAKPGENLSDVVKRLKAYA